MLASLKGVSRDRETRVWNDCNRLRVDEVKAAHAAFGSGEGDKWLMMAVSRCAGDAIPRQLLAGW